MAKEELKAQLYNKVLYSRYSQENKCFVKDDETLTVLPRTNIPQKEHVKHYFVSVFDLKTKSQYGWVKEVKDFTLESFIETHYSKPTVEEKKHVQVLLDSISRLEKDTVVAATYSQTSFMDKTMVLKVHKVILYQNNY